MCLLFHYLAISSFVSLFYPNLFTKLLAGKPMRKTYKPIARAEQVAQIFKKKTLAVTDNLNIKQDADNLENVDEYWSAAASVIGNRTIDSIDDTIISGESDTLFNIKNIKQSIKNSIKNEEKQNKKRLTLKADDEVEDETETSKESGTKYKLIKNEIKSINEEIKKLDESLPMDIEREIEMESIIKVGGDIPEPPFDVSDDLMSIGESETKENKAINEREQMEEGMRYFRKGQHKAPQKTVPKRHAAGKQASGEKYHTAGKQTSGEKHTAGKQHTSGKRNASAKRNNTTSHAGNGLEILNSNELAKQNKVNALVCTDMMNTAVMSLDFMAYVRDEVADKTFSIYLVKGAVEIEVDRRKSNMRKGEVTVIAEGSNYSMSSMSKTGSMLFLTYAL